MAVASNNLAAARGSHELFDSWKRFKQLIAEDSLKKLTPAQQQVAIMNKCILLMQMGKMNECAAAITEAKEKYPDDDVPYIVEAASAAQHKNSEDAEQILEKRAAVYNTDADLCVNEEDVAAQPGLLASLTLAQLKVNQGDMSAAIDLLKQLKSVIHTPGAVSTVVALSTASRREDATDIAKQLLAAASSAWTARGLTESSQHIIDALQLGDAEFKLQSGGLEDAAEAFQSIIQKFGADSSTGKRALCKLVMAK